MGANVRVSLGGDGIGVWTLSSDDDEGGEATMVGVAVWPDVARGGLAMLVLGGFCNRQYRLF